MRLALASIANSTWVACVALAGELRAELEGLSLRFPAGFLPTRHGLLVLHGPGLLEAELEWSPLPENLAFRLVVLSLH